MKALIIPKGETRTYESLVIDNIVVSGHLNVVNGIKAKNITGHGVITAGSVSADVVAADEVETESVVCKRFLAKRATAAEVFASESAAVSCFLSAAYVETGKLTVAAHEIGELKAGEVVQLTPRKRGLLLTLIASMLLSLWLTVKSAAAEKLSALVTEHEDEDDSPEAAPEQAGVDPAVREMIAKTVREVMDERRVDAADAIDPDDFELKRVIGMFQLLRKQGYTLRVVPGTPEENAPVYDFEKKGQSRPAA